MLLKDSENRIVAEVIYHDESYNIINMDKNHKGIILIDGSMMIVNHQTFNVIDIRNDYVACINKGLNPNISVKGKERGYYFEREEN